MAIDFFGWLNISCAIIGATIFGLCIVMVIKIIKLFPNAKMTKDWKIINILIIFFLFAYLLNIIAVIQNWTSILLIMQALVYLFGAIFVFIVVRLSLKTYKLLLETAKEEN